MLGVIISDSLEVPPLHSTGYEPKASDARRFDTQFVLPFKQVIRRDDTIVCPHLTITPILICADEP